MSRDDSFVGDLRDELERRTDELRESVECTAELRRTVARLRQELSRSREQAGELQAELHHMRVSVSWRLTAPLRKLFTRFPGLAVFLRRAGKVAYYTLTGRIFRVLKERRTQRKAAKAVTGARQIRCGGVPERLSAEKATRLLAEAMNPARVEALVSATEYSPKISLLVPTYNTPPRYLLELVHSVRSQTYQNWQLCIADDGSKNAGTKEVIERSAARDPRIRYILCDKNRGIGGASMEAAKLADGDYVSMLDHDDALAPGALSAVVSAIRKDPDVDMFYTDHAMMSEAGDLLHPALKPGWSPEFFLSTNYVVHFKTVRKSLFDEIGGFEGTHDLYTDGGLILKLMRANAKIQHIPGVQYFWRIHEGSVSDSSARKPGIIAAATGAVNGYLEWKGVCARSVWAPRLRQTGFGIYKLEFPEKPVSKVAVIVPVWPDSRLDEAFFSSFDHTKWPETELHLVGIGGAVPKSRRNYARIHTTTSQAEFDALLKTIDANVFVFVPVAAIFSSAEWLREISGYLTVSDEIGAVGGKVLDPYLKTESSGIRLIRGMPTMSFNMIDTQHGYWFENTISGNVEAVSIRLMAVRKSTIDELGAPPVVAYEEQAGIAYCLKLRERGYRTVYNPWAKVIASRGPRPSRDTEAMLRADFGADFLRDRYYHTEFDLPNA